MKNIVITTLTPIEMWQALRKIAFERSAAGQIISLSTIAREAFAEYIETHQTRDELADALADQFVREVHDVSTQR